MPGYCLPDNEWTHRGDTWPYMSAAYCDICSGEWKFRSLFLPDPPLFALIVGAYVGVVIFRWRSVADKPVRVCEL